MKIVRYLTNSSVGANVRRVAVLTAIASIAAVNASTAAALVNPFTRPQQPLQVGLPESLSAPDGLAQRVTAAMNPNPTPSSSEATAVWDRGPSNGLLGFAFESAGYNAGSKLWSSPLALAADTVESTGPADQYRETSAVGMANNGDALAIAIVRDPVTGYFVVNSYSKAAGAPSWQSQGQISQSSCRASQPSMAVNPSGRAVAAWVCTDQGGTPDETRKVQYARKIDTGWTVAQDISGVCRPVGGNPRVPYPDVAINGIADAVMAWNCSSDGSEVNTQVQARLYSGVLGLRPTTTLSQNGKAAKPEVGITSSCRTSVAYYDGHYNSNRVVFQERRPINCSDSFTSWKSPVTLSSGNDSDWADLAMNLNGDVAVIWSEKQTSEVPYQIKVRYRAASETNFRSVISLTQGDGTVENDGSCSNAVAAIEQVAAGGDVLMAWTCADVLAQPVPTCYTTQNDTPYCWRVQAAVYGRISGNATKLGYVSESDQLAGMNHGGGSPSVAVGEDDRGLVTYGRFVINDPVNPDSDPFKIAEAVSVSGF